MLRGLKKWNVFIVICSFKYSDVHIQLLDKTSLIELG